MTDDDPADYVSAVLAAAGMSAVVFAITAALVNLLCRKVFR